jgi:cysteine synthase
MKLRKGMLMTFARVAEKLQSHSSNGAQTGKAELADCRPHMGQKQQTRVETMPSLKPHQVLIVGGGTAGITVAAILKRRAPDANIVIVEPAHDHYYQPAFTLVGAGVVGAHAPRGRKPDSGRRPVDSQFGPDF